MYSVNYFLDRLEAQFPGTHFKAHQENNYKYIIFSEDAKTKIDYVSYCKMLIPGMSTFDVRRMQKSLDDGIIEKLRKNKE